MAVKRLDPYVVGDIAKIGAPSREAVVRVVSPSRVEFTISGRRGWADVWVLEPGAWSYEWSTGEAGTLDVIVPPKPEIPSTSISVPHVTVRVQSACLVEVKIGQEVVAVSDMVEGGTALVTFTFRHPVTRRNIDPEGVELKLKRPGDELIDGVVSKESDGVYSCAIPLDQHGIWKYSIESKGSYPSRTIGKFEVIPGSF